MNSRHHCWRPCALCVLTIVGVWLPWVSGDGRASTVPAKIRPWQLIVIHHSATRSGSAGAFDANHRMRGMINGLAYHFVIDNGTNGTRDGFIETGTRWVTQLHGGHCRQADINERGIGICLVGDFSRDEPTHKQLDALVLLIKGLQEQFKIPTDNVLGHGEIIGESSECPGHRFPWNELRERLNEKAGQP
jgi:N-acetylmuramoyl-L-alanine amidase